MRFLLSEQDAMHQGLCVRPVADVPIILNVCVDTVAD